MPFRLTAALSVALLWTLACAGGEEVAPEEGDEGEEVEDGDGAAELEGSGVKDDPYVLECGTKARDLPDFESEAWVVCPDDCSSGSVWGTCTYTFDSSVCRAAVHAGALTNGLTKAMHAPGEESYTGSEHNGVTSSNWGSYGDTLTFARTGIDCGGEGGGDEGGGGGDGAERRPGRGDGGGRGGRDREVKRPGR